MGWDWFLALCVQSETESFLALETFVQIRIEAKGSSKTVFIKSVSVTDFLF